MTGAKVGMLLHVSLKMSLVLERAILDGTEQELYHF